jgi:hypothetical protein
MRTGNAEALQQAKHRAVVRFEQRAHRQLARPRVSRWHGYFARVERADQRRLSDAADVRHSGVIAHGFPRDHEKRLAQRQK